MTADEFLDTILAPDLTWLRQIIGPVPSAAQEARLMLLAIPGQESGWQNIQQGGGGPGRGFFQMEPPTCSLILNNPVSVTMSHKVCSALNVSPADVYANLIKEPQLAVAMARFDLFCDPYALPAYGDEEMAWICYAYRVWRPGAVAKGGESATEARKRWSVNYAMALAADKAWSNP